MPLNDETPAQTMLRIQAQLRGAVSPLSSIAPSPFDPDAYFGAPPQQNFATGGRAVVGHDKAAGLDVSLEEHKGEMRHRAHSGDSRMAADYGYITHSPLDADHMKTDAYVGPHRDSNKVFVINQKHPHTGRFNEHKVMLGYKDRSHAVHDYVHSFDDGLGHKRVQSIVEMDKHELKDWLKKGPHTRPVHMAEGGLTPRQMAGMLQAPEDQGAVSPSMEGVSEAASNVARGAMQIPETVGTYIKETSEKPDPSARLGEDIGAFAKSMAHGAAEDPAGFIGGALPVVGNVLAGADISKLKDMAAKARAEGDDATANKLDQLAAVAAASIVLPAGAGVASKAAVKAGEKAAARELSAIGLYSHGAETALALPQAKGTPEQMAAMLQKQGVKPEEMFSSGFADEAATNALRGKIEADFQPRIEAAQQAIEGLTPGTEEFKKAERLVKNLSSTMRADMDRALVLSKDIAERPALTREEASAFFKEKMPVVEEKILGKTTKGQPYPEEAIRIEQEIMDRYRDDLNRLHSINADPSQPREARAAAEKEYTKLMNRRDFEIDDAIPNREQLIEAARDKKTPTQFGQYTLPGSENYREVLLKMPVQGDEAAALNKIAQDMYGKNYTDLMGNTSDLAKMRLNVKREYKARHGESGLKAEDAAMFRSSHWDDPNVLAHIRMADRTGPNGEKILHVEELQSDWAQKGRKEGFKDPEADARRADLFGQLEEIKKERTQSLSAIRDQFEADKAEFNAAYEKLMFPAERELNASKMSTSDIEKYNAASDEALRQTEHLLYPVEQKFHKASKEVDEKFGKIIDPLESEFNSLPKSGEHPSAPYVTNTQGWTDLALKRVLKEAAEGGYDKVVWTPGAEQAKRYDLSKQIDSLQYVPKTQKIYAYKDGKVVIDKAAKPDELEGLVGKEVAKKLLDTELKAPEAGFGNQFHYLEGQDLSVGGEGMKGYYDKIVPTQLQKLIKKMDPEAKIGKDRLPVQNYTISAPDIARELGMTVDEVAALPHDQKMALINTVRHSIAAPSLTITPKMREAILGGMPHMAEGGSVNFAKGGSVGGLIHETAMHADGVPVRQLAYMVRVASGMKVPQDRAVHFAQQILDHDEAGLNERFQKYGNAKRTLTRLNALLTGKKHKFGSGMEESKRKAHEVLATDVGHPVVRKSMQHMLKMMGAS